MTPDQINYELEQIFPHLQWTMTLWRYEWTHHGRAALDPPDVEDRLQVKTFDCSSAVEVYLGTRIDFSDEESALSWLRWIKSSLAENRP